VGTRGAGSQTHEPSVVGAPRVSGASCRALHSSMDGPRGRRLTPWGPSRSNGLASLRGPPRPVTLSVPAKPVTFQGARRPGGQLPPVTVRAVYAREPSPSQGEELIAW
jgi:hypothetical protein